jgi:TonB-linked SusC/RagA family outer membrane protein
MSRARLLNVLAVVVLFLPAVQLLGQNPGVVLTGRITTTGGAPIDGASVLIPDAEAVVRTSSEGRYRITIPSSRLNAGAVLLRARAIGYVAQTKRIAIADGNQEHDFTLERDINRLETVVVTGTVIETEQKKLPFSVAKLDTSDMPVLAPSVLSQLQGKVPGALIVQPSGRPGSSPAIVLRGPKSLNATGRSLEPLYILDGAILNAGTQDIDASDIEGVEVIKGAAASTLYGSRAGAGVIQITTKSGRRSPSGTHFTTRSEAGFNDVQSEYQYARRHILMMDEHNQRFCIKVTGQPPCSRTVDFAEEARRINEVFSPAAALPSPFERDYGVSGGVPAISNPTKAELKGLFQVNLWPVSYNPIAQVIDEGASLSNTIDFSSRAENTSFFASLSNLSQNGAMKYLDGYRRTAARANLDQVFSNGWTVALNTMYAHGAQFSAITPSGFGLYTDANDENFLSLTRVPAGVNLLQRDQFGRLYIRPNPLALGTQNTNPLYAFENLDSNVSDDRFIGSLSLRYAPSRWLTLDATGSADRRRTTELGYIDRDYRTPNVFGGAGGGGGTQGMIDEKSGSDLSQNLMLSGKATLPLEGALRAALITRYSYEREDTRFSSAHGEQLAFPGVRSLSNATANIINRSSQASVRAYGVIGGAQLEYKERYLLDGLLRYDGSSLFGADERWHPYFRTSLSWRLSDEPFWPVKHFANDVKLRASVGTAGGRPNFAAQYETFVLGTGGVVTPLGTLGNRDLKPEHTIEAEYGIDAEIVRKIGFSLNYARAVTSDQLLPVPAPAVSGFAKRWENAATVENRNWELSMRIPLITSPGFSWSAQLGWDRQRTYITKLNALPFTQDFQNGYVFNIAAGERYGTMYGRRYATRCSELPAPFDSMCGDGKDWQKNDEGYIVWVGAGHSPTEGITLNLWQTVRPGCVKDGVALSVVGEVECRNRGGTLNAPWGVPETHWGMPTVLRDSLANPTLSPLGNTMPDYRVTFSHNVQRGRVSAYALFDVSVGNYVFNSERRWSLGDFMAREEDQNGKTPETAKPIGYYWRGFNPPATGVGGFYADNRASNRTVEDGSYTKLREVRVAYDLRRLPLLPGMWTVALVGRNVYTWTRYTGYDPEGGFPIASTNDNGSPNSAAITTGGLFQYPSTRQFTVVIAGQF